MVRLHLPEQQPEPGGALVWLHGGGYVGGYAGMDDRVCRGFARELGIAVAAVDYRLAPRHPFPAGLDDAHAVLRWLADQPYVDRSRVAVGGASAGGGLAAALALAARDRGDIDVAFQLLSYPMLDDRTVTCEVDSSVLRLWDNRDNIYGWRSYLTVEPGSAEVSGLAAPGRHSDLAGLPPAWIGVGTSDLFHDEDVAYAERLRAAGVPCQTEVVDGAFHGFDVVCPRAAVSRRYRSAQVEALRRGLNA